MIYFINLFEITGNHIYSFKSEIIPNVGEEVSVIIDGKWKIYSVKYKLLDYCKNHVEEYSPEIKPKVDLYVVEAIKPIMR